MRASLTTESAPNARSASWGTEGGRWRQAIARYRLITFFVLAFLFSWYPWIIALFRGRTSGPNPLGPLIAALLVAGIADGWPGVRELLGRIVRGRIGLRWYIVIFGLPVVMCASAIALMAASGRPVQLPSAAAWRELPERFLFIFLFVGLGEEPRVARLRIAPFAGVSHAARCQPDPRADLGAVAFAVDG